MPSTKKPRKSYRPKHWLSPERLDHVYKVFSEDLRRIETSLLIKLRLGESTIDDLNELRSNLNAVQFILIHRREQFTNCPVIEWFHLISSAVNAICEGIERAQNLDRKNVVFTGDELKLVEGVLLDVFPFLHDLLTESRRQTALEFLASAKLVADIRGRVNGFENDKDGNFDYALCERYFQNAVNSLRRGTPI